jgi:hypothetical protein
MADAAPSLAAAEAAEVEVHDLRPVKTEMPKGKPGLQLRRSLAAAAGEGDQDVEVVKVVPGTSTMTLREKAEAFIPATIAVQDAAREVLQEREELRDLPILWKPSAGPQTLFLQSTARECLMGGAVFGGKSEALLMGALRWVYNPAYSGIILRREKEDLRENIDRAREFWPLVCPGAEWVESRSRFEFPSGATILFGSAQHEKDIEAYKSFEFSYVGIDELTTFLKKQYVYMISRNRAKRSSNLPTLIRAGTNPDGPGHQWVYNRFIHRREPYRIYRYEYEVEHPDGSLLQTSLTRQFIPSTVFDNPHVGDLEGYIAGLRSMGKHLADALLYGRWDYFQGQMFPYRLEEVPAEVKDDRGRSFLVRAMDYGWSDPSVILWLLIYQKPGEKPSVEVVDELVLKETNIDGLAHMIKHREEQQQRDGLPSPRYSVIDPSAAKREGTSGGRNILQMLQDAGIWFTRANNDRQAGWAQVRRFLETDRLQLWTGRAPYLRESLPKLVRDPKKADDLRSGQDDHGADTLRYGVMAVLDLEAVALAQEESATSTYRDRNFDQMVGSLQGKKGPGSFHTGGSSLPSLGAGF